MVIRLQVQALRSKVHVCFLDIHLMSVSPVRRTLDLRASIGSCRLVCAKIPRKHLVLVCMAARRVFPPFH